MVLWLCTSPLGWYHKKETASPKVTAIFKLHGQPLSQAMQLQPLQRVGGSWAAPVQAQG